MGGDCLNYGCFPSEALLAAGHAAHAVRSSGRFGVNGHEPEVDFARVLGHVHGVIASIAPHDPVERFERLGVEVIQAAGRFVSPREIKAGGKRIRARRFVEAVPWVTYTDPDLAQVGLGEAEARAQHGAAVWVMTSPFADNDRARAEAETEGFIKVVTGRRVRVLGATIVGKNAGDLILPWLMAVERGLKIRAMASSIAPYPTLGEIRKRAAGRYFTDALFGARTRRLVRLMQRLA